MKTAAKNDPLDYLVGEHKARLIRYCLKNPSFYQAQAASDLHWNISTAQYHLENFVKHHLLTRQPTSYRTYYHFNPHELKKIFPKKTCQT